MQQLRENKIEYELDNYVKEAVRNGVTYAKLEKWMDKWEELSSITERYGALEIYEAFHKMPSKIKKYTGLINGEEMYFVLDIIPNDDKQVRLELIQLLNENKMTTLVRVEDLKYTECKNLIKSIRFERELPIHLKSILVKEQRLTVEQVWERINEMSKTTSEVVLRKTKDAYKWLKKQELKQKFRNKAQVLNAFLKTSSKWLMQKWNEQIQNLKIKFIEAKKNNFGINIREVKNTVTNVIFYGFLGTFLMLLMLINL